MSGLRDDPAGSVDPMDTSVSLGRFFVLGQRQSIDHHTENIRSWNLSAGEIGDHLDDETVRQAIKADAPLTSALPQQGHFLLNEILETRLAFMNGIYRLVLHDISLFSTLPQLLRRGPSVQHRPFPKF